MHCTTGCGRTVCPLAAPWQVLRALQPVAAELAGGDPALQRYVAAGGGGPGAPAVDPTRLVTLCSEALRTRDAKLLAFANQVRVCGWVRGWDRKGKQQERTLRLNLSVAVVVCARLGSRRCWRASGGRSSS